MLNDWLRTLTIVGERHAPAEEPQPQQGRDDPLTTTGKDPFEIGPALSTEELGQSTATLVDGGRANTGV